jgi:hypothetical protein
MPNRQVPKGSGGHAESPRMPSRRRFLRQAGLMGAVTAAFVGAADLAGMSSAVAGLKPMKAHAHSDIPCCVTCTYSAGHCNGGKPCSSGSCCFHCVCNMPSCCNPYYKCIKRPNCNKFTQCA